MGGAGPATTPTVPHIFCPGDYIQHYSCVLPIYCRFDNLIREENRVAKIFAVACLLFVLQSRPLSPIYSVLGTIQHYSCVPIYCRFDNLIRKCNRREQGCQNYRCSFVIKCIQSQKYFKILFLPELVLYKF